MASGKSSPNIGTTVETSEITDSAVTNAKLANMAANTAKVNNTAGAAAPTDLALTANTVLGNGASGNIEAIILTAAGRALIDDADAAAQRATLGVTDATVPTTSAMGDAAGAGVATVASRNDHRHGREAFVVPALVLGTANAAGVATTPIRSDATIAAFDATAPTTSAVGDAAAVGTAAVAARRDHAHGREAFATPALVLGTANAAGVATTPIRSDATIAAFDTTVPVTQASADAAATGTATVAARRDHRHGMPTLGGRGTVMVQTTVFETAAHFTSDLTGGGTATYDTRGVSIATSATATSGQRVAWSIGGDSGSDSVFLGSPLWSAHVLLVTIGTDFDFWVGLGLVATGGGSTTFTFNHAGFKMTRRTSGTISLYATQADGTTETASAALETPAAAVVYDLIMKMNGATSVDYYRRVQGGALSAATNLSANLPGTASRHQTIDVKNAGVATNTVFDVNASNYER